MLPRESRRAECLRHEHLIRLYRSLPSELASCGYHALQASVNLPAAHGQWYGIGGHPVWYKGATGSRQSRCSASSQACRWLSRGAAPGGRERESLGACSKGKTPCCRCELSTASPPGLQAKTPDQDTNAATSSSTGLKAMKECLAKVISSAPPAFCRVKGDVSHVVHFCRGVDAPSYQIIILRLISRLELEARVTKRALAGLARTKPSEVPRARRSHMVVLLPQVEGASDGMS